MLISVKPIAKDQLETELKKKIGDMNDWVWSNKDSVRVDNVDYNKNKPHERYCVDCYYLININAQRKTEASVMIPTPGTEVPLAKDTIIKDLLLEN